MKKYLLIAICIFAVITSGCGIKKNDANISTAPNKKTETLMKNLAVAAMANDNKKMTDIGNALEREQVRPKELIIKDDCVEFVYFYENKEQLFKYCK